MNMNTVISGRNLLFFKSITPSQRHLCLLNKSVLDRNIYFKKLCLSVHSSGGRNNHGITTVLNRSSRKRQIVRVIDFFSKVKDVHGEVRSYHYDPFRSCFITLISFINGTYCYSLVPQFKKLTKNFVCNYTVLPEKYRIGDSSYLKFYPNGIPVYNLESKPGSGSIFSRASGSFCFLLNISKKLKKAVVRLNSDKIVSLSLLCRAYVGILGNQERETVNLGKAGRNRWIGKKPHVRGVAMNPIDHPHGGGEGKKSARSAAFSVWGRMQKATH